MKKRAVGVVYKDGKILLIHRIKEGRDYFVFPGGTVEENEDPKETMVRELGEELTIKVKESKFLFNIKNFSMTFGMRDEYWYLVKDFTGTPVMGGPELERMNKDNQYHISWKTIEELNIDDTIMPEEGKNKVIEYLDKE